MDDKKREEVMSNMVKLNENLKEKLSSNNQEIVGIIYERDFRFKGTELGLTEAYKVKIRNNSLQEKDKKVKESSEKQEGFLYEIYDEDNNLVATINKEGEVQFEPEYLEKIDKGYIKMLGLENAEIELPEELERGDLALSRKEIEEKMPKKQKGKEEKEEQKEEDKEQNEPEVSEDEEEKFAKRKGIPRNNVLKLRTDSNFLEDHPEVEENTFFYKDNDGIVKAEYIDENGETQPSKFFEDSTTAIREETVSMGDDGVPVKKEIPYQTMLTKNLNNVDKDIREIRININIDSYGYLEISEARQGTNGMWSSHAIEVEGRDYNSYAMNKMTSIETRKADPNKFTESYKAVEGTEVAQDGIEMSEMFLMQYAQEIIQSFVDEGYNKEEAIEIFDLMVGEEKLTVEQAKKEVNETIKEQNKQEKEQEEQKEEDEGRTPWGDAEARRNR